MKIFKIFGLLFALSLSQVGMAQEVQWADTVLGFSSQLSNTLYSARQVLFKPNVLPNYGENPAAWTPNRPNREEFLKVGFKNPQVIQQVAVAETYNPSTISRMYAYDGAGKEYLIYTFSPRAIDRPGRLLNFFIDRTPYEVHALKIVFDGKAVEGYYSIDAIGISDSNIPISVQINVADNINPDIKAERLSENVNSPYREMSPLVTSDGRYMFFSRQNHPENKGGVSDREDIWISEYDTLRGEWKKAQNIGDVLNNKGPNFVSTIIEDGENVMLLLGNTYEGKNNDKMKAGLSVTYKTENGWTTPEALDIINGYNYSDRVSMFLSNSKKILLMSMERDDTYGQRDLYVSFLRADGRWSEPLNLGSTLNTVGEEEAPYLAPDETTLYFSSDGFSGYGGKDIFISRRLDDTWQNWSEPENMGPGINSVGDDKFFNIPLTGDYAYFTQQVGEEDDDIFRVAMPVFFKPAPVVLVKGKVIDSKTGLPIAAKVIYERLPSMEEAGVAYSDPEDGSYEIVLPAGYVYGYTAIADGFISESENIDLTMATEYVEVNQNLKLVPAAKGEMIVLNNIFFEFDKFELKSESFNELRRLLKFLNENDKIEVAIEGHTCDMGSDVYNKRLSERRAKAVYDWLKENGIPDNRMISRGFSFTQPIESNKTIEGRQKNRRVEFKIMEDGKPIQNPGQ